MPKPTTTPRSLSGGQRKLLEMARSLMTEPTLVMLDEPMAGVNPALTQSLLDHILDLKDEGMTVLFVEHDMHMVRHVADWVVVMAEGRIVAEGPPGDGHERPRRDRRLPRRPPGCRPRRRHGTDRPAIEARPDRRLLEAIKAADRTPRSPTAEDEEPMSDAHGAGHPMSHRACTADGKTDRVVVEITDLVAGYLPGVNILNGCTSPPARAS